MALAHRALLPAGVVANLVRAIPVEFAVVHASGFLAWPWVARWVGRRRALFVGGLAAAYTLALVIVSLAVAGAWPLVIFWALMVNRMLEVLLGDLPDDRAFTAWSMAWAGTTALYVLAVVVGVLAGPSHATMALVIGFLYFTLVALSELTGWTWVYRWMSRARGAGPQRRWR